MNPTSFDLDKIESATRYPSIPTYHTLDRGILSEPAVQFPEGETVFWTEKVDGTNGRIILLPDGDWFIGSREQLLAARGDRLHNPAQGIVDVLRPVAEGLKDSLPLTDRIKVFFLEVYGHKIGAQAKQYTGTGQTGYRLFDVAFVPSEVLGWERDRIAGWRDHGGQRWATEATLGRLNEAEGIPLVPRMGYCTPDFLPQTVEEMHRFLAGKMPKSEVTLDDTAGATPEGLVLRTSDRSVIAKARFEDYERTARKARKS